MLYVSSAFSRLSAGLRTVFGHSRAANGGGGECRISVRCLQAATVRRRLRTACLKREILQWDDILPSVLETDVCVRGFYAQ